MVTIRPDAIRSIPMLPLVLGLMRGISIAGWMTARVAFNSSAIETCVIILRPGADFVSFALMDSFYFTKADSADIFCYEVAR